MTKGFRQREINAIVFFASNTARCGKIKLFKLLYLLDFQHFQEVGQPVTGLEYQAWKFGPVPTALMEEWEEGFRDDLAQVVAVEHQPVIDYVRQAVVVNDGVQFDDAYFSPRQLRIMNALVAQYGNTYSPEMIDVTHAQNGAWDKVWRGGEGRHQPIPYELAIGDDDALREELLQAAAESNAFASAFIRH